MLREIERKFLVRNDTWREATSQRMHLIDGLLASDNDRKVRVRFYDERATLTFKGLREGIGRDEFEFDIPAADGRILLEKHCQGRVLEKTRHLVSFDGLEWTVDEYHGLLEGVVLAEIELPSEDTVFSKPGWLGREVTGNPDYRKANLLEARKRI